MYNDNFNFKPEELANKLSIDEDKAKRILDLTTRGSASHSANTIMGGYKYDVIHPITGKPCKILEKGFRFTEKTMHEMLVKRRYFIWK